MVSPDGEDGITHNIALNNDTTSHVLHAKKRLDHQSYYGQENTFTMVLPCGVLKMWGDRPPAAQNSAREETTSFFATRTRGDSSLLSDRRWCTINRRLFLNLWEDLFPPARSPLHFRKWADGSGVQEHIPKLTTYSHCESWSSDFLGWEEYNKFQSAAGS